jgi:hypothetical protein
MIYNNSAYILLGHIIEKASGMSYERYVAGEDLRAARHGRLQLLRQPRDHPQPRVRLPDPGHEHATRHAERSHVAVLRRLAVLHRRRPRAWLHALHGGRVLSERSYEEMTSPSRLNDGTPLRYGMALSVGPDAAVP